MIQYASFTGFIRTILILILIYYGIKLLTRMFAPILMRYVAKKAEQKFGQPFDQNQGHQQSTQKEGEISIDKNPQQHKTSNKDVGEYVDFEEID